VIGQGDVECQRRALCMRLYGGVAPLFVTCTRRSRP
jgi:hypothetical protein